MNSQLFWLGLSRGLERRLITYVGVVAVAVSLVSTVDARLWGTHEHEHGGRTNRPTGTWSLVDLSSGDRVSDQTLAGMPYVVVFHLGQGCLHCQEQLSALSNHAKAFRQRGVELLTVSTESPQNLAKSMKRGGSLPFRVLSDPDHEVFKKFHAYDLFNDQPLHGTLFVNSAGTVRWKNIGHHPFLEFANLVDLIREVQEEEEKIQRPKILLDRSPRIVAYQLGRLNNERLLLVERSSSDKKYLPVHKAILTRGGMSPKYRDEALAALVKLNDSTPTAELLVVLNEVKVGSEEGRQTAQELAKMLLRQPREELLKQQAMFREATESDSPWVRQVGFAALMASGQSDLAWKMADQKALDWLNALSLVPEPAVRNVERERVVSLLGDTAAGGDDPFQPIQRLALGQLAIIPGKQQDTFERAAAALENLSLRSTAIDVMLATPANVRVSETSQKVIHWLIVHAESMPAAQRTGDSFLAGMQLADQLLASVPIEQAKRFRKRLREVAVRVVKITTIEDEMRYDIPYFAVEAGRPVQLVLDNHDLMAHNLVVTKPGQLKIVAQLGGAAGPGAEYLPADRSNILFATRMVPSDQKERITFEAPSEVGEYPYVCTFPQHWSRMYGVMVVVSDLDAWATKSDQAQGPNRQHAILCQKMESGRLC